VGAIDLLGGDREGDGATWRRVRVLPWLTAGIWDVYSTDQLVCWPERRHRTQDDVRIPISWYGSPAGLSDEGSVIGVWVNVR
jgi:hypothetical protein